LRHEIPFVQQVASHLRYSVALGEKPAVLRAFGIILGGTIVFVVGLIDDIYSLKAREKMLAQVLAALVTVSFGVRLELFIPIPLVTWVVTIFWIVRELRLLQHRFSFSSFSRCIRI
jgi:UDP-N-acetylmuramyl pentapeptide phosphotransferase/UDP-N-acetylglucosamine-1-phosphate transferase